MAEEQFDTNKAPKAEIAKALDRPDSQVTWDGQIMKVNWTQESKSMPTIGEQLKAARAKLADARQAAASAVSESADAANLVLQEVDKARKEAADLRAEVAELTNGGPA